MLDVLPRLLVAVSATASVIVIFAVTIIAVFVAYIGIALWAVLRARDAEQRKFRYKVLRALLRLFDRGDQ